MSPCATRPPSSRRIEGPHADRLRPADEQIAPLDVALRDPTALEPQLEPHLGDARLRSLRRRQHEEQLVGAPRSRRPSPGAPRWSAQGVGERGRKLVEARAPRGRVQQGRELLEQDVAHAAPPGRLLVERRRGAARVGEQLEGLHVPFVLIEQHQERARGVGVGPVREMDEIGAGPSAGRLRALEPFRLLGVECAADLVGPGALRVELEVARRMREALSFVRRRPERPVVGQVARLRQHLPGDRARDRRRSQRGTQRSTQRAGPSAHSSPPPCGTPASGTRWQKSHSVGFVGAVSDTNDA
jgi:hypothetical protein